MHKKFGLVEAHGVYVIGPQNYVIIMSIINHVELSHEVQLVQGSVLLAAAVLLHSSANVSASKTVLQKISSYKTVIQQQCLIRSCCTNIAQWQQMVKARAPPSLNPSTLEK